MHISHMQSVQLYATPSFDAVSLWQPAFHSWDFACVPCARDVVTEMAVALHAIGVKCDGYRVAEREAQRIWKVGPSAPQDCEEQQSVLQSQHAAAVLSAASVSVLDIAL